MRNIRTITLDLDDTLWAIHPVIERAENKLYDWLRDNYPRITEMCTQGEIRKLREDIVFEYPGRSHDFTFLRRTVLGRLGIAAVEAGGAKSHETLHVGDHPEADVVGATQAGLKSVWVNRGGHGWPDHLQRPDGIVRDVGQLLSLLGVLPR
jgi:FMN phosphatase YigB (HAD superfamily)